MDIERIQLPVSALFIMAIAARCTAIKAAASGVVVFALTPEGMVKWLS